MYLRVYVCGHICCNMRYAYACMHVFIMHIGQRKIIRLICVWSANGYFYSKICVQFVQ